MRYLPGTSRGGFGNSGGGFFNNGGGGGGGGTAFDGSYLPDTDATVTLGRNKISSGNSDWAQFQHVDTSSTVGYAVAQTSTGVTLVNFVSGQSLNIQRSGSTTHQINSSLEFFSNTATPLGTTTKPWSDFFTSGYWEGTEMTAPSAPAANKGRVFFQDNGAGKTQMMVIFPSGAAQQIAIEP